MANQTQMPASSPQSARNDGFRSFKPCLDSLISIPHSDYGPKHAEAGLRRFQTAQGSLEKYGATIEFTKNPSGALALSVRLSFPTNHEALDSRINEIVCGLGFSLRLESVPVSGALELRERPGSDGPITYLAQKFIHTYHVGQGRNTDVDNADCIAEDLLKLASLMAPLMIREERHKSTVALVDTPVPVLLLLDPLRPRDSKQPTLAQDPAAAVAARSPD